MCDAWFDAVSSLPRRSSSAHRICIRTQWPERSCFGAFARRRCTPPPGPRSRTVLEAQAPRATRGRTPTEKGAHGVTRSLVIAEKRRQGRGKRGRGDQTGSFRFHGDQCRSATAVYIQPSAQSFRYAASRRGEMGQSGATICGLKGFEVCDVSIIMLEQDRRAQKHKRASEKESARDENR